MSAPPDSPGALREALAAAGYLADDTLATTVYLALTLERPLLIEGPAGVGKTALAGALAEVLAAPLHRLQCYDGLDAAAALYDWDYPRQLLAIRQAEADTADDAGALALYSERYLLARPILAALRAETRAVLLIDELDRADEAFEALLLEVLAEWQISIPEYAIVQASMPPVTVLTGNRTRELSDAVRRRCLYLWIDTPDVAHETAVLRTRLPDLDARLAERIGAWLGTLRERDLARAPGLAESLDWARALMAVGATDLTREAVPATLGALLKDPADLARIRDEWARLRAKGDARDP